MHRHDILKMVGLGIGKAEGRSEQAGLGAEMDEIECREEGE